VVVTRLLTVLCLVATALASSAARWSVDAVSTPLQAAPDTTPSMQELLRKAGEQVVAFGRDLESIVAREAYVQTVRQWPTSVPKSPSCGTVIESDVMNNLNLLDPIPPGEILMEEFMRPLGISIRALARELAVPPAHISGIVEGTRPITPHTAIRLASRFGVSPELWRGLQSDYDLRVAARGEA
jgi:addiction module HigA family antidote